MLLFVTCIWIIYEAVRRLFFTHVAVDVSFWAFLTVTVSIVVDFWRSRALSRAARKYNSQAGQAPIFYAAPKKNGPAERSGAKQ